MQTTTLGFLLSSSLFCSTAWADQCRYLTRLQAETAVTMIQSAGQVFQICEPCGELELKASTLKTIDATAVPDAPTYWHLRLNGVAIDIAYTYLPFGRTQFINLSKVLFCPSEGVSFLLESKLSPESTQDLEH